MKGRYSWHCCTRSDLWGPWGWMMCLHSMWISEMPQDPEPLSSPIQNVGLCSVSPLPVEAGENLLSSKETPWEEFMSREQLLLSQFLLWNSELAQRKRKQAKVCRETKSKRRMKRRLEKIIKRIGTLIKVQSNRGNSESVGFDYIAS